MPKKKEPTGTTVKKEPQKTTNKVEKANPAQLVMSPPAEPPKPVETVKPAVAPSGAKPAAAPAPAPAPAPAKAAEKPAPAPAPAPAKATEKPAPAPAKAAAKPALASAPAKVAVKSAPAKAAKPAKAATTTTVIVAKFDVGFGNNLYIRGDSAGLNWDSGVPMKNVENDVWVWTTNEAIGGDVSFKFLINDESWSSGDNMSAPAGETTTLSPSF